MPGRKFGSLSAVSLAVVGVAALGVAPVLADPALATGLRTVTAAARLLDTEAIVIGGSGDPIPSSAYVTDVSERYLNPAAFPDFSGGQPLFANQPQFPFDTANPLFTPEGLYPFEGVKELELDPSVAQGLSILNSAITDQLSTPGNDAVVLGYSQSAIIASQEMRQLLALPADQQPTGDQLSFSLIGDIDNPNGGIFPRFDFPGMPNATIPSLGITFDNATPSETPWDTAIYTLEYDGFADFPKYPLDLLSDINAVLGIAFIHGNYPSLTADQVGSAIQLSTSADYTGDLANTDYYMIPTENLPLLDLVRAIPTIGKPIADLLQPDLKVLVDLGYGNVDSVDDITSGSAAGGWDTGPANVATPFGLFPNINVGDLLQSLVAGAEKGWSDFTSDLSSMSSTAAADPSTGTDATDPASFTDIVNAFSSALSQGYASLLPTADIINALFTTMPAYDVELFTNFIQNGDVLDAIGMPVGVDFALLSVAGGFELRVIENMVEGVIQAFDPSFSLSL